MLPGRLPCPGGRGAVSGLLDDIPGVSLRGALTVKLVENVARQVGELHDLQGVITVQRVELLLGQRAGLVKSRLQAPDARGLGLGAAGGRVVVDDVVGRVAVAAVGLVGEVVVVDHVGVWSSGYS